MCSLPSYSNDVLVNVIIIVLGLTLNVTFCSTISNDESLGVNTATWVRVPASPTYSFSFFQLHEPSSTGANSNSFNCWPYVAVIAFKSLTSNVPFLTTTVVVIVCSKKLAVSPIVIVTL